MRVLLALLMCCAVLYALPVYAGQPYLVSELGNAGNIWRIEDTNTDGDALDVGERVLWADGLAEVAGLEMAEGFVYASNIFPPLGGPPQDEVIRLADLNGDGDALDLGESVVWAAGLNQPVDFAPTSTGGFYVTQLLGGDVLRLEDLNADGDALDIDEQVVFSDGFSGPTDLIPWGSGLLVADYIDRDVFFIEDKNGDGDALDAGEKALVLSDAGIGAAGFGLHADGNGGVFVSAFQDNTVYLAKDNNQDGDFLDVAEVVTYADDVFGGLSFNWDLTSFDAGGFLLANRGGGDVAWVRDKNGDGDALDLGEVTTYADGMAGGPGDLVALSESYNADYDDNGAVDGFDFLKWQRGESPQPLSAFDLELWETQYGSPPPATAVPEASSFTIFLIGMLLLAAHLHTETKPS